MTYEFFSNQNTRDLLLQFSSKYLKDPLEIPYQMLRSYESGIFSYVVVTDVLYELRGRIEQLRGTRI